jgi:tRNA threonylcarbamoyladenosine biosynthesis protein TsaE
MTQHIITTHSEAETSQVGRDLASGLGAGSVVLLFGDLGAGKTAFVRGLAEGLGVSPDDVSSPTFTIMQEYRGGRVTLFHVDLYRLEEPREIEDLGLNEIAGEGILVIEWAERLPSEPRDAVRVRLEHADAGGDARDITIYN